MAVGHGKQWFVEILAELTTSAQLPMLINVLLLCYALADAYLELSWLV